MLLVVFCDRGTMRYQVPHFIQGKKILFTGRQLDVYHPALGQIAGEISVADASIIGQAILSAQNAFKTWSKISPQQRAKYLFRYKTLLDQHLQELGDIISKEHGKT